MGSFGVRGTWFQPRYVAVDLRSVRHGFESTSNHDIPDTKLNVLCSQHNGLQTRGTDLVDGGGVGRVWDTVVSFIRTAKTYPEAIPTCLAGLWPTPAETTFPR